MKKLYPLKYDWMLNKLPKILILTDTDFVALTKFLKATLWTGDKVLYNGLRELKFKKVLNTTEMLAIRIGYSN